jgi:hypothetical protein
LAQFAQGHPRRLQLAAHKAWEAAPPGETITVAAAESGIAAATERLDRREYARAWRQLSPAEQALTQAMALHGATRPRGLRSLHQDMPAQHRHALENAVSGLLTKDVIHELPGGRVAFNDPGMEGWVLRNRPSAGTPVHVLGGSAAPQLGSVAHRGPGEPDRDHRDAHHRTNPAIER